MIDFALEAEREEGKSPREAIHQACLLRFRPILMTTMAALLGALPLMLGNGTGSELRHPLGVAIVGGLIVSQVLTLFTTPVIYLLFDRLARAACRRSRRQRLAGDSAPTVNISAPFIAPPGGDDAADHRHRAGRHLRLLQAAGRRRCRRSISRPSRCRRSIAGRQSGDGGDQRRRAAGTPSRADRRCHRDDLDAARSARRASSCNSV